MNIWPLAWRKSLSMISPPPPHPKKKESHTFDF